MQVINKLIKRDKAPLFITKMICRAMSTLNKFLIGISEALGGTYQMPTGNSMILLAQVMKHMITAYQDTVFVELGAGKNHPCFVTATLLGC